MIRPWYIVALFTLTITVWSSAQITLQTFSSYAANHEEYPKADDLNWINPDYQSFEKTLRMNIVDRLMTLWGFSATTFWNPYTFKSTLETLIKRHPDVEAQARRIVRVSLLNESRLFIWQNLFGAFHSLIRALEYLQKEGVIDEKLTLLNSNDYLIFNGNVIDRSPYSIETLSVVLTLLERNPNQCIYIQGAHEHYNFWHNFGLKTDLMIRAAPFSSELIPFGSLISTFFNTLPCALYINSMDDLNRVIRISPSGYQNEHIDESHFDDFFKSESINISYFNLIPEPEPTSTPLNVIALIKQENWMREHRIEDGLGILNQDEGVFSWTAFSSPTSVNQEYYSFFYDAFVQITLTKNIERSTIQVVNRDVRTKETFKQGPLLEIISGASSQAKSQVSLLKTITIGSSIALDKGLPVLGIPLDRGIFLKVNDVNINGGINGNELRVIVDNDDYAPEQARKNILNFIEKGIDIIHLPLGTPTLAAYLDIIQEGKALVLFPLTGASAYRTVPNIINFRVSYSQEVEAMMEYMYTDYGARKFAFFYQDDDSGRSAVKQAEEYLKKRGITSWTSVAHARSAVDLKEQAEKVKLVQPDALALFSVVSPSLEFIRHVGLSALANTKIFAFSSLGTSSFKYFAKRNGLDTMIACVVPNPRTSQLPIAQEYRNICDKVKSHYDVFSFEAYVETSVLVDALSKIEAPYTKEKLRAVLESYKNYDFKGLNLTFIPETHTLMNKVWLYNGDDQEWVEKDVNQRTEETT